MSAVEPGITTEKRGSILSGLGIGGQGGIPEESKYTHGNDKYTSMFSNVMGIWLTAAPAK